ncbi:MAG: DMT family transporter [Chloroflexi bacterium]|nr:MAG: DMT family transporter [Chloroflexota bacterium]
MTAVWGWTFVVVKDAIAQYPTLPFLTIRFALALLVMIVIVRRLPGRRVLVVGAAVGVAVAAGYVLQTVALQLTAAGNAGLITGLFVVFTPLLERLTGRAVPWFAYVAVVAALVGTVLLAGGGPLRIGLGEMLLLGCALAFAIQIVMLSHWSPGQPAGPLALVQMATVTVLFAVPAAPALHAPPPSVWPALVITGVFASALAMFIQTWAQQQLSASRTAVILATEPAWALFFSVLLTGQRLGPVQASGAFLVLAAIFGYEAGARWTERKIGTST